MSLETIQNITLDLTVPRIKNVRCVQDDRNSRIINIVVTNDGEPFFVTKDMIVSYKVYKADDNYVWNKQDVIINDDGTVTIELSDQAVAFVGIAKSSLKIQENTEKISTLPFNIIVEKAVVGDDVISSTTESDIIDEMENHLIDYDNPHRIPDATTEIRGLTQLENSVTSTSTTTAATPNSVKTVNDDLTAEVSRATTVENNLETNKADKTSVYTKNEVDNKFSTLETNIDWKEAVETYDDIAITYPNPTDGWTVNVKDTDYTYRYNGTEWIAISANAIPKATNSIDGLLSKEDHTNYEDANSKKHTHNNKSIIDKITQTLLDSWNSAVAHISDSIKHITSSERINWNTAYEHTTSDHTYSGISTTSETDLNNIITPGMYRIDTTSAIYTHAPSINRFILEVSTHARYVVQKAFGVYGLTSGIASSVPTPTFWIRSKDTILGTWSSWQLPNAYNADTVDGKHASDLQNQNAFSNIAVGSTTVPAGAETDTLTLVSGLNVTISADSDTNEITISSAHPSISKSTDSTSTASPSAGGTFTAVDSVTRDGNGHVTKVNTKTVTLPNTAVTVDDALSSTSTNPVQNKVINNALSTKLSTTGNAASATYATNARMTTTNPTSVTTYYLPFTSGIAASTNYPLRGNNGLRYYTLEGTTSANGYSMLLLGNSTKSGTAANKYGAIRVYGTGAYYTQLAFGTQTENRTITFPNATGTVALTGHTHTSTQVTMGDGNTAETNLGAIQGITSSLATENDNYALSASAGKNLQDQITDVNTNLNIKSRFGIWTRTIGKVKEIFFVLPVKISSTYSESTGMYFSIVNATLPSDITISDKTYMNVQTTVQSVGIYSSNFVDYNISNKIFTFYIFNVKEFSNIDVKLHVSIKIPSA